MTNRQVLNFRERCSGSSHSQESRNAVKIQRMDVGMQVYPPPLKVMSSALNVGSQGSQLAS